VSNGCSSNDLAQVCGLCAENRSDDECDGATLVKVTFNIGDDSFHSPTV